MDSRKDLKKTKHNTPDIKSNKEKATLRWRKLSGIIAPKTGKRTKMLDQTFWREAYTDGVWNNYVTRDLFQKWKNSNTSLGLKDWLVKNHSKEPKVVYYDSKDIASMKITINNGKLFEPDENKVCTFSLEACSADFIVCPEEQIYSYHIISANIKPGFQQHASILSGGRIIFAGMMSVLDGKLKEISLRSGHYKPTIENLYDFVQILSKRGVDLSNVSLFDEEDRCFSKTAKLSLVDLKTRFKSRGASRKKCTTM